MLLHDWSVYFPRLRLLGDFTISHSTPRPRSISARHPRLQNPDRLANYAMCSADRSIRLAECLADAPPICKKRRRIGWPGLPRPSCAFTFFRFLTQRCGVTPSVLPFNSITALAQTAQCTFIARSDKENEHTDRRRRNKKGHFWITVGILNTVFFSEPHVWLVSYITRVCLGFLICSSVCMELSGSGRPRIAVLKLGNWKILSIVG